METEAEKKQRLEKELETVQRYVDHPITREIFQNYADEREKCLTLILEIPVTNIETFFAREHSIGLLHGLRRAESLVQENLDRIKEELKETK